VIVTYRYTPEDAEEFDSTVEGNQTTDLLAKFFELVEQPFIKLGKQVLTIFKNCHIKILINLTMIKDEVFDDGKIERIEKEFNPASKFGLNLHASGIKNYYYNSVEEISEYISNFNEGGSGWVVKSIDSIDVIIGKYIEFTSARPKGYLKMPIKNRKGFINPRNTDDRCFHYCVVMHKHHEKFKHHKQNVKQYDEFFNDFDFNDVIGDIDLYGSGLKAFESKNKLSISVYSSDTEGEIFPIRKPEVHGENNINLFLIIEGKSSHFVYIRDLKKFMRNGRKTNFFLCPKCNYKFFVKEVMQKHSETCAPNKSKRVFYPGDHKSFSKPYMTLPYPYIIFFDFESFLVPTENDPDVKRRKTEKSIKLDSHKPASYSLCIVEIKDKFEAEVLSIEYYNGDDIIEHFYNSLFDHAHRLLTHIRETNNKFEPDQETMFDHFDRTNCQYCNKEFNYDKQADKRTFHHNHHTGIFQSTSELYICTYIVRLLFIIKILYYFVKKIYIY